MIDCKFLVVEGELQELDLYGVCQIDLELCPKMIGAPCDCAT